MLAVLVACAGMLLSIFSSNPISSAENAYNTKLKAFLASDEKAIHLSDLTNFEWTAACIYLPYSIDNSKKFSLDGYTITSSIPNMMADESTAILFKQENKHTAFFIRTVGDLNATDGANQCFSQKVTFRKGGSPASAGSQKIIISEG
jgi:hypothetical protein